jgi:hypothetical protein
MRRIVNCTKQKTILLLILVVLFSSCLTINKEESDATDKKYSYDRNNNKYKNDGGVLTLESAGTTIEYFLNKMQ